MEDSIHRRFQFQWMLLQPDLLVAGMELEKRWVLKMFYHENLLIQKFNGMYTQVLDNTNQRSIHPTAPVLLTKD